MILGFSVADLLPFVGISLAICVTVCALAMEASVLFVPAFLFLFPGLTPGFPSLTVNEAIGLAITVEFFGYTSSVTGYWLRGQVDFPLALRLLAVTVPLAGVGRVAAYFLPADGLMVVFGLLLVALAAVVYRSYRNGPRHGCLLCGDSIAAMHMDRAAADKATVDSTAGIGETGERSGARVGARLVAHAATPTAPWVVAPPTPALPLGALDCGIMGVAGGSAGLLGIGIGEITTTLLATRKSIPVKRATGTSALVLHVTILAALTVNLVLLKLPTGALPTEGIAIPWRIAAILAPVVVLGGQLGSLLNSRLSERLLLGALVAAYPAVGGFMLVRALFF